MTSLIARLTAVLTAFAAALLLASCGSNASNGHTEHEQPEEPVISGQPAGFNSDDVAFATNMIPHHQQAVELSALVPERSTNPEVKALAEQISAAQEPEIQAMKVLLVQWNENPDSDTGHGGHGGHAAMQGMVDDATMAKLKSLSGPEFDTLWLESMISHHQGAIEMARAELANGENVDAKRLAQTMVDTQQAEIDQMNRMLKG
ncbi:MULTISPECIES: DUF305 domain-containing protein [unclassified Mycobacterium]|uniref:DUF305 domain-containing protein n=1 Tax=unclassified Mycobacterium TaxID=2642494 RepID=UPI0007404B0A|nr:MULTISPECIES: DUF305 domain-containing protein [unclassified Mycobacterium]KUH82321.1 DUF305 domain-containing protein [Mycobacterium sp. GA-0227b]KUH84532.1 DUF305 domain-containing protein [Mycobacterium sp. GA-1999]KUH95059.1 DUF305 domain-containing protein [Mycobacterium sp. IS-1556]